LSDGGPDAIQKGLGEVMPTKFVCKLAIIFPYRSYVFIQNR